MMSLHGNFLLKTSTRVCKSLKMIWQKGTFLSLVEVNEIIFPFLKFSLKFNCPLFVYRSETWNCWLYDLAMGGKAGIIGIYLILFI